MSAARVSPSSSPRLPSPPPFTEVQIGPKSPSVGESFGKDAEQLLGTGHAEDDGSLRRIRPGTKTADMASGPPLIPLSQVSAAANQLDPPIPLTDDDEQLDSPFQLQEHLKALHNHYTKPENSGTTVAINREVAVRLAQPPEGIDRSLWLYELCRFLTMKVNNLIIAFFAEEPPCSSQTCPEMRASEWQYLCAVHDPPKSCCAIDYCCHTLDWATNILTSPKFFPSRLTLGPATHGGSQASMKHLTNIFRRLYRIFAHAWFQHRDVFWQVEGNDGLYIFFKTVCDMYNLIPEDNYTVPAEAEGLDAQPGAEEEAKDGQRLTILRKEDDGSRLSSLFDDTGAPGATTRRHKHTASAGSRVTTIAESAEDTEDNQKMSLPEVPEEPGKDEIDELPVRDAGERTQGADVTSQETAEAQEESHEPSESQPVETQPPEPQQPEHEPSGQKEQQLSEEPLSKMEPVSSSEKIAAEEQDSPVQPAEKQSERAETEESNAEAQPQQKSAAEKTITEGTTETPKPAESTAEAPKET